MIWENLVSVLFLVCSPFFFQIILEPVLSTGVYIHPSGYSYTVAPNGVWYFHNADGTPPSTTPGAPPMAYAPNTMQKIQSHSPPPFNGKGDSPEQNRLESHSPVPSPVLVPQGNLPMCHGMPVSPEIQTTQIIQADIPYVCILILFEIILFHFYSSGY